MRLLSEIRNYMGNYHVKSGVYHYYRKEFRQAVQFLTKALGDEATLSEGDLKNAKSYLTLSREGLADKLAEGGDDEAALTELRLAVAVDGGYPDIHFRMARTLERLGRLDEAIASYRGAAECHPGYLEALVALAGCLARSGELTEAAETYRRALELKIHDLKGPFEQGVRLLESRQADAALECFHEVFSGASQRSKEYLKNALEFMHAEKYDRALVELDRAIELNPKYADVLNFRGIVLCELERFEEALEMFRGSADLTPGHVVPRLNRAFTFLRADRVEEGQAELQSILADEPTEPVARAKLQELEAVRPAEKPGCGAGS